MLKTVPADTADGSASSPQPARHPAVADAMIARQPILDLQKRLHGYGLVCCDTAPASDVTDSPARQARLTIHHVMHVMGFDALVGGARAYIRVAPDNLLRQEYAVLPPERTVLELDEPGEGEGDWLDLCRGATEAGYRLAVNRDPGRPRAGSWLPGVEAVKFDIRAIDSAACQSVLPELKRRGITAIAAHVETQEAFRRAASLGFDLVQGYFFCEPEVIKRRTLLSNQAVCLHLLAELAKPTLDLARIEAVVKSDVALSFALLRYLNSAAMGLGHRIDSIRQALVMLGERPLRRWGFLASIHALGKGKPHQLLLTALVRARFCEQLAERLGFGPEAVNLYLVGLLSTLDAILDTPLEQVLDAMPLHDRIRAALLGRGEGPLGVALSLAKASERGAWTTVNDLCIQIHLTHREIAQIHYDALRSVNLIFAADGFPAD